MADEGAAKSRPSRARGLKLGYTGDNLTSIEVAPITGAWIETQNGNGGATNKLVAPITGAWIETSQSSGKSLASQVAPITGAWIETRNKVNTAFY